MHCKESPPPGTAARAARMSYRVLPAPDPQTPTPDIRNPRSTTWYTLAHVETVGGVRRGERVLQVGVGSGIKCGVNVWKVRSERWVGAGVGSGRGGTAGGGAGGGAAWEGLSGAEEGSGYFTGRC